ncbi:nitroreductase family protein [Desulfurococcaceae archaeon MEX13E-LK6-19]|nr:nitroreductase family protein [Desulfurococcaceae archaeon MEX13E-LK6-19]
MDTGSRQHIEFLLTRRSIRRFEDKPVPRDLLLKVIDVARYAPSAKNLQPWEFIIVDDPEVKKKLSGIHVGARPLENAPAAIVVVADKELSPVSYLVDGANATMYILLAAHAYGLGTVWIQTLRNISEIQKILGLPENKVPVAIIAIGWPAEKPGPRPRKPLEELVHINKYGNRLSKQ